MPNSRAKHGGNQITINPNEVKGTNVATTLATLKGKQAVAALDSILNDPTIGEPLKILRDWAQKHPDLPFTFTSE
jgi:hypothetical protein